jgi:hypothetical protein
MNAATIRAAIHRHLLAVPAIGKVHLFERYAKKQDDFRKLYVSDDKTLLGWHIRRLNFTRRVLTDLAEDVVTHWEIRGFMALEDDQQSELAFDDLIDAITVHFTRPLLDEAAKALNGVDLTVGEDSGLQLTDQQPVLLGGILCHQARLSLRTSHEELGYAPAETGVLSELYLGIAPDIGPGHEADYEKIAELPQ